MKKLKVSWSAVAILAPAAILCAILVGSFHGPATASANNKGKGSIQVAFITNVTGLGGKDTNNYQNLFLNVTSVRISPKPKPTSKNPTEIPPEGSGSWVTIPLPSGVGGSSHGNPGDLQIDALAGQNQPQFYNTGKVKQKTYHTFEVELDAANPGFVVPTCSSAGPYEGCINYPIIFQNPGAQVAYVSTQGFQVNKGQLTLLLININVSLVGAPSGPGQPYTANVTVTPATQTQLSSYMGVISGTVSGKSLNKKKESKLTVSAEQPATGIVISSAPVQTGGNYQIYLPASSVGTIYDLYSSGGSTSYEAIRLPSPGLVAGQTLTEDFNNVKGSQTLGTITGTITDQCTGQPIVGATLKLLIPSDSYPNADCADPTQTSQCEAVATANTDNVGDFPIPGTAREPAAFQQIPILPTSNPPYSYTLEVSAAGYDTLLVPDVVPTSGKKAKAGGKCGSASSNKIGCDLSLSTGYVTGTVTLGASPPNNENVLVQVFAELSGTNQLVGALPTPLIIRGPNTSVSFASPNALYVPTGPPPGSDATSLDLFAYAIDLYQGAADPYSGHTIIVQAHVPFPTAPCANSSVQPFSTPMECVGHGSVVGTAANPDTGTTVSLIEEDLNTHADVILETSPAGVVQPSASAANSYSFCAAPPPLSTNYFVQRYEQEVPPLSPDGVPTAVPVGSLQPVTAMATPVATSTPCPSTCSFPDGTCPGVCGQTAGPGL